MAALRLAIALQSLRTHQIARNTALERNPVFRRRGWNVVVGSTWPSPGWGTLYTGGGRPRGTLVAPPAEERKIIHNYLVFAALLTFGGCPLIQPQAALNER